MTINVQSGGEMVGSIYFLERSGIEFTGTSSYQEPGREQFVVRATLVPS